MSRLCMKNPVSKWFVLIAVLAVVSGAASALGSTFRSGDDVHISNLHNIDDDFYASGNQIRIDGTITGDVTAASYQTSINGQVGGSANLAGRYIDHSGQILGSLRFAGERLTVNGFVGRSIVAFGSAVTLGQGAVVEKDVSIGADNVTLDGIIRGDVECAANRVHITAQIDGDLSLEGGKATVAPPAVINGNITYIAAEEDALELAGGVTVAGEVIWKRPEAAAEDETSYLVEVTFKFASLFAAFLFGIIVLKLFRPYAEESFSQLRKRLSVALAAGVLGLLVLTFCILVLVSSLMAMLIGTVLLSGDYAVVGVFVLVISTLMIPISSFVSVSGGIILYSGKIIVGLLVGYLLIRLWRPEAKILSKSSMLLGLLVLTLVFALPYVGYLIFLLTTITGAGAIILGIRHCRKRAEFLGDSKESSTPGPQ
ncbi:MAG: polymer-forming cytoskeletal protein [bacterium]|nr:polymer-forming cytoskeletal protein [bacterium]